MKKDGILNGCTEGDWEGEFTYMVNERLGNKISRFRVGDRVDSDHMPLEVSGEMRRGRGQDKKAQEQERRKPKVIEKIIWNKVTKTRYKEKTREWCRRKGEENKEPTRVENKWQRIKKILLGSMVRKRIRIKDKELEDKDWDRRCTRRKRELKKV